MFTKQDFDVFEVPGLEERMAAIRTHIQPKFQALDTYMVPYLEQEIGTTLPIHIAQHIRRTTNAPDFTWSAMGGNKRGYKKFPHFTLGINGEYIVMWLSFIDNPENEKEMAQFFLDHLEMFAPFSEDFVVNTDHTVNNYSLLNETDIEKVLVRWRDIKKGEFQIGRIIRKDSALLQDETKAKDYMLATYLQLVPLYQAAYTCRK